MAVAENIRKGCAAFYGENTNAEISSGSKIGEAKSIPTTMFPPEAYQDAGKAQAQISQAIANHDKQFKDSGARQDFGTGAVRDTQTNKGRFDLIPPLAELLVACVYEEGGKKYADRNWESGIPISRFIDSARRHLAKYVAGFRDEPHLSMALWNLMCATHTAAGVELGTYPKALYDLPNHTPNDKPEVLSKFEKDRLWR
jgi:hypothetical protein